MNTITPFGIRAVLVAVAIAATTLCPVTLSADDKTLTLTAPESLSESGLLKYMLPRFSLKTGVRVTLGDNGGLVISESLPGTPIISRGETVYYLNDPKNAAAARFADWLISDVGKRTLESFVPETGPAFAPYVAEVKAVALQDYDGNVDTGEKLSLVHCGRCHVINESNRMNGLGSTPSFSVLKTLSDWPSRFEAFFALNPHPAFTQIPGVTEPFDKTRPSPIAPIEITLEDLDAILAFVSGMAPADLGAPIQHQ